MALWLAGIGGEIIKLDHSFKASKRIRDATGQQQYAAVLTLMNEFCQVGQMVGMCSSRCRHRLLGCTVYIHLSLYRGGRVQVSALNVHHPFWCCCAHTVCPLLLQIHATIPTHTKSLLEVREHLAVFMENQEKLGVGPEAVSMR